MTASARMNGDRVPGPHEAQHLSQLRPIDVCAQQPVWARLIEHDAIELALRVLLKRTQGYSVDRTFAGQVALHGRSALGRPRLGGCPPEPGGLGVTFFGWELATRSR